MNTIILFIIFFKSPKNTYEVKISPYQGKDKFYSVGFGVSKTLGYDTDIIVNENPYEVMQTVFSIMLKFIEELKDKYAEFIEKYNLKVINGFIFSFTGDKMKNDQRLLLYKRYIKKYLPNSELNYKNGIYYIEL